MPIITFWSNNEKAIGQTVSAASVATVMAIDHNYKVLLISADINNAKMKDCFGSEESNREILKSLIKKPQMSLDSGINGLLKMADSNRVTPDMIHDYTKIVFNRLEVLYSPMNLEENKTQNFLEKMKNIILNAARYYDQVIVDLKKGLKYNEQLEILNSSDVIIANTDPGTKTIEQFFQIKEMEKIYNKVIWNICKSDKNSKYNSKNILRTILKKQVVCEVPYNTLLHDACEEGKIAELMLRFRTIEEESDNKQFLLMTQKINEQIFLKYQETRIKI